MTPHGYIRGDNGLLIRLPRPRPVGESGCRKGPSVPAEEMERRMGICHECPHYMESGYQPCDKEKCRSCWEKTVKHGKCKDGRF